MRPSQPKENRVGVLVEGPSSESRVDGREEKKNTRARRLTYSSRTKLPKDMPPQLMPPMTLPARDSLRARLTLSRLELFTEMGFGPALTNESPRGRPMEGSNAGPVVIM